MLNFIKPRLYYISELIGSLEVKDNLTFSKEVPLVERVLRGFLIFTIIVLIFINNRLSFPIL